MLLMDEDFPQLIVNSSIKIKNNDERDTIVKFLIKISGFDNLMGQSPECMHASMYNLSLQMHFFESITRL